MKSLAESLGLTADYKPNLEEDYSKYEGLTGQEFARAVLDSPEFRRYIVTGILAHDIPPQILARLMDHGWGKPAERVEHSGPGGQPIVTRVERVIVHANALGTGPVIDVYGDSDSREPKNTTH